MRRAGRWGRWGTALGMLLGCRSPRIVHARLLHVGNGSGNGRDRQQGHDGDHLQRIHGSPLPPIPPHTLDQDRQDDPEDHDHGHGHGPEEGE